MVDKVKELSAKISSGGRLYKDAREAAKEYGGVDDEFDDMLAAEEAAQKKELGAAQRKLMGAKKAKSIDDHPMPPQPPPWTVQPMTPDVAPPKPKRDWQEVRSTMLELSGISVLTVGFWMLYPWLGVVVLGFCLVALGVAEGLPAPRPPRRVKR